MKFAAIDIGSNAVRLLFAQVFEFKDKTVFKKDALYRVPIRLGEDVFTGEKISNEKIDNLVDTMIAFNHLIKAYHPLSYMACATSAMRESANKNEIIAKVKKKAGVDIEIIDGEREAEIIYTNHIAGNLDKNGNYFYIDVGGGSTEITLISESKIVNSQSFNVGTVRLLKNQVKKSEWQKMKEWLKDQTLYYKLIEGIGSGGNINKIYNMTSKKNGKPINKKNIKDLYKKLISLSYEDRISKLGLRPDRADVIVPAAEIFLSVFKWGKIKKMFVPQFGLSDGIIHVLYERQKNKK